MKQLLTSPNGRTFLTMWSAESLSTFGSRMTFFAFGIWWFQETGLATPFFLFLLAAFLPGVLFSPFAGVLVDRFDRRQLMMLATCIHLVTHSLQFWLISSGNTNLVLLVGLLFTSSIADTFNHPAWAASITVLLQKEELTQANGLQSMTAGAVDLLAPLTGAFLVSSIGIAGILLFDLATYVVELLVLLLIRIPKPPLSSEGAKMQGNIWSQAKAGFVFITARAGLFGLLLMVSGFNFLNALVQNLQVPLVLSRTSQPEVVGLIAGSYGAGVLLGGFLMSSLGGVRPRVYGVFLGVGLTGAFGLVLFGVSQSLPLWMLANVLAGLCLPLISVSSQVIWQAQTPPDVQGRVFSARRQIAHISVPVAYLLAGTLADFVFKPVFSSQSADQWAWLLGGSNGRGYAAMFVLMGVLIALLGFSGFLRPAVRNLESQSHKQL